jgi:hypothetical protein
LCREGEWRTSRYDDERRIADDVSGEDRRELSESRSFGEAPWERFHGIVDRLLGEIEVPAADKDASKR